MSFSFSLYIHIPFCRKKCRYCDFYSEQYSEPAADRFLAAVAGEWEIVRKQYGLGNLSPATVFCGGGTPSLLRPAQWARLCTALGDSLNSGSRVEWTVECNPDSYSREKARAWLDTGVNRLSVGVQSLDDRVLALLGRPHRAHEAIGLMEDKLLGRFQSVGVDIIYGVPGQTVASLERTLMRVLSLGVVGHVSAYELTVAQGTPLGRHRRLLPLPSEDEVGEMYDVVLSAAREHGLVQYEVSNYARTGNQCEHNRHYWRHDPYIGLGPGAHSFMNSTRSANMPDLDRYVSDVTAGRRPLDFVEELDPKQRAEEILFLGLRTREGVDAARFEQETGEYLGRGERGSILEGLVQSGHLVHEATWWRPTDRGIIVADAIARSLMDCAPS